MEVIIETIMKQLDPMMIESELGKIRDIQLDMEDIQMTIADLRSEIGVWEKLNPFSQSDEKKELKYHKGELKYYKKEYQTITNYLRNEISSIIQSTPSLRMKSTVSEMFGTINQLRSKLKLRQNQHGTTHRKFHEIKKLEDQAKEIDILMENQFGFLAGKMSEKEMIEVVMNQILNRINI